jgi:hypothetical protein
MTIEICVEGSTWLSVASTLLVGINFGLEILTICKLMMIFLDKFYEPNSGSSNANRTKKVDKKLISNIIGFLRNMIATEANFTENEDACCICLDNLTHESKVTVLPCHPNHCLHLSCISEWIETEQKCPICKATITLKNLNSAIKDRSARVASIDVNNRSLPQENIFESI